MKAKNPKKTAKPTAPEDRILDMNFHDSVQFSKAFGLNILTDNRVRLMYRPNNFFVNDKDARGHLFIGDLADHAEMDADEMRMIVLDDRLPDSLELQLAKELRKIAAIYEFIAAPLESISQFLGEIPKGNRWAKKCFPAVLQKLMRHADISTTMSYYVNINAEDIADGLWAAYEQEKAQNGNTCGNTEAEKPCISR
jgi:hypothetical protein